MSKFKELDDNAVGLVQAQKDGRIVQIGLSEDQSIALQLFLAAMSKESPLLQLPAEYDLELKIK